MTSDKKQKREYSIEEYNPAWVKKFEEIREMLKGVFGEKALAIEHVGSTSIAGMKAKPIIDVLIIVEKNEPFQKEKELMLSKGYKWGENYIAPDTQIFWMEDGDKKTQNIHICVKDSPKAIQFIATRDYLRVHPERAKAYGEVKEKVREQFPDDYPAYSAGKQAFLDETERLSYEWLANDNNKI